MEESRGQSQALLKFGIGAAIRKIQIAQQFGWVRFASQFVKNAIHPRLILSAPGSHHRVSLFSIKQRGPETKPTLSQ
jgi:hypothetical protein